MICERSYKQKWRKGAKREVATGRAKGGRKMMSFLRVWGDI